MDGIIFLYTTWPDAETAASASRRLVEQGLAACANIMPPMTSIYRWQGEIEQAVETVVILKTGTATAKTLCDTIAQLHPYETPCIVALPAQSEFSWPPYLSWVAAETSEAAIPPQDR